MKMKMLKKMNSIKYFFEVFQSYFIKYILSVTFVVLNFFIFCNAFSHYHNEPEYFYLSRILGNGLCTARGTAPVLNLTIIFILLPVNRTFNRIIHKILAIISTTLLAFYLEKIKQFHLTFVYLFIVVSVTHSLAHIVNGVNFIEHYDEEISEINWAQSPNDSIWRLLFGTLTGFSGVAMILILVVMCIFSRRKMRDRFYDMFLYVHHLFILLFIFMLLHPLSNVIKFQTNLSTHEPGCKFNAVNFTHSCSEVPNFSAGEKQGWIFPTIAIIIFIFDHMMRLITKLRNKLDLLKINTNHEGVVFIKFQVKNPKSFYRPGQYILLQCRQLSTLEWHPFTIIKSRHFEKSSHIRLAISIRGDWTSSLYDTIDLLDRDKKGFLKLKHLNNLEFVMDGPFPSPMEMITKRSTVIFIAAGIGITPIISVINNILLNNPRRPKQIRLIWICRDLKTFCWFEHFLRKSFDKFWTWNQPDRLNIEFYCTAEDHDVDKFNKFSLFLRARFYHGRPQWDDLFNCWTNLYSSEKSVTVCCCGPKSLRRDVKEMCIIYSAKGGNYKYLHEAFN